MLFLLSRIHSILQDHQDLRDHRVLHLFLPMATATQRKQVGMRMRSTNNSHHPLRPPTLKAFHNRPPIRRILRLST